MFRPHIRRDDVALSSTRNLSTITGETMTPPNAKKTDEVDYDRAAWALFIRTGKGTPGSMLTAPNGGHVVFGTNSRAVAFIPHGVTVDPANTDPYVALFGAAANDEQKAYAKRQGLKLESPDTAWSMFDALAGYSADERFLYALAIDPHYIGDGEGTSFAAELAATGGIERDASDEVFIIADKLAPALEKIRSDNAAMLDTLRMEVPAERTAALSRLAACRAAIVIRDAAGATGAQPAVTELPASSDPAAGVMTETRLHDTPAPGDHQPARVPLSVVQATQALSSGAVFTTAPDGTHHVAVRTPGGQWQRFESQAGTPWRNFPPAVDRFFTHKPAGA